MGKLRISVFIGLVCFFSTTSMAQKGTQSPYSVFGLGEINNGQYAYFMAMGNALTANTDSTIVNQNNPASYSYISRYRPLFQIGLNGKLSTFSDNSGAKSKQNQFGLNQFQLGFPIAKRWGGSFGLTPYSSTGYNITNSNIIGSDTISQFINEGEGTISKFHFGTGYKRKMGKTSSLAIGLNVNYIFGASNKIESFEYYSFPNLALHSRVERKTRISALNFDLGLIYEQKIGLNNLSIGLKYSPSVNLKANQDLLSYSYSESYYSNYSYGLHLIDTVQFIQDNSGTITMPEAFNVGFEYHIRGEDKTYLLKFSGDLKFQKWSSYSENFNGSVTNNSFKDRTELSFGMQYTPHVTRNGHNNVTSLVGRMHYRLGFNYTLSELYLNSTQLTDSGISFGLGIPITTGNSNTSINLGVKYGTFGTTDVGLIQENYFGMYVGFTISPGVYDRWFLKRKYD